MTSSTHETEEPEAELADSPPLQGERVAFTGTLAAMTHREACRLVERNGGTSTHSVSRQTTMLVVGEEGWALDPDGQPSQKLRQVLQWQLEGVPCRVVREADWLHLIGLDERRRDVHGEYTPAMLSRLINVPVSRIRRWERIGILQARRTVGRLPLFNYQEMTGAQRIAELLETGVSEDDLYEGLAKLRTMLPPESAAVSRLPVVSQYARFLYRDERGLKDPSSGQRCFDFVAQEDGGGAPNCEEDDDSDPVIRLSDIALPQTRDRNDRSQWIADDWFREGYRLLEENELDGACEAFRMVLMDLPGNPEANFYLAEALYRQGNRMGAMERYYAAAEADHDYLEAWTQLGCILTELDDPESALDAFEVALRIHPDNPDAHWHKADLLWRVDRKSEAIPHWEEYLRHDSDGPWAETAQQRLKETETAEPEASPK